MIITAASSSFPPLHHKRVTIYDIAAKAGVSHVTVALALLRFSARLPVGKFFSWSSALVAVLAVVLTGKGIAALQEAGWIGSRAFGSLRIDLLGVYPSVQALLAQLAVVALVIAGFYWNSRSVRPGR